MRRARRLPIVLLLATWVAGGWISASAQEEVAAPTAHSVRLLEPPEGLHLGALRVGAVVEGEGIAKVQFLLDGRLVLTKVRPPYGVEFNLGRELRPREISAIAVGRDGEELARDLIQINSGPYRFAVRLIEPVPGQRYEGRMPARAELILPIGDRVERVDFKLGEELVGSDRRPPYRLDLPLESSDPTYVRAIAYLEDGSSAEDLVFANSSRDMAELRVSFVELYTSVLDRKRNPVDGLTAADFTVKEDGVEQRIRRFEKVLDRQVSLGILLDVSRSMTEELEETKGVAASFLERMVRPNDRATIIAFADTPEVRVPFSNDLEALAAGLDDLVADGETTLFDSLAFALYYFGGLKGKRAIVVLTDGEDSRSEYGLSDIVEYAQRLGVAIYPIAVSTAARSHEHEGKLRRLASATGGSIFFIQRASEIEKAYARIEAELRSQYLIGYQSTHTARGKFRQVKVGVDGKGLVVRTVPGYYP